MTDAPRYHSTTDKANAITKRRRHEIVADEIRKRPELVAAALEIVGRMGNQPQFEEWRELLQKPPHIVAREIVKRTENMDRLRIDSPFFLMREHGLDFTDEAERRALYRAAKAEAEADQSDVLMPTPSR
jgi:hypothetical protein